MTLGTLLTTAHTTGAPAGITLGTLPTHGMTRGTAIHTGDGDTVGTTADGTPTMHGTVRTMAITAHITATQDTDAVDM